MTEENGTIIVPVGCLFADRRFYRGHLFLKMRKVYRNVDRLIKIRIRLPGSPSADRPVSSAAVYLRASDGR